MKNLQDIRGELAALAEHVGARRAAILLSWQAAIKRDPKLTNGDALPRGELVDHIPAILAAFEHSLTAPEGAAAETVEAAGHQPAAEHGLQRWKQGYDLREVARELGKLNECVVLELNRYAAANPNFSREALTRAQEVWATMCSTSIEESVSQYFALQREEAAGQIKELEQALDQIRELEQQRGEIWQQAAHDLRGNLSVVANVTVGLTRHGANDATREDFVRLLMRNVTSLHHLLNDVTSLARLQAGREKRQIEALDLTTIFEPLCEGVRHLATQRGLYLHSEGPAGFATDGDPVKIRRIAQNLILNAVKYTREGGVKVTWGDSRPDDPKRWLLTVKDTGPGFSTGTVMPLADARSSGSDAGEGIGLSIVKRLCEMLDATIEMESVPGTGTSIHVLFPRHYSG